MATPLRSSNPALNSNVFLDSASGTVAAQDGAMTLNGTVNKTAFLLILVLVGAMYSWSQSSDLGAMQGLAMVGAIGGFVVALVTIFKAQWAMFTSPVYALLEGLFIGAVSSIFEAKYPGIVIQAVGLTFGTMGALLLAYRSGLIRATEKFRLGVFAATGGVALFYLASMIGGFFGHPFSVITSSSPMGIGLSAVIVIIAALNLILDFDSIERGVQARAPKYMEWYGAFGLVVTLVWLYLEFLRLLSKLNSRN
ncbi:MAG: Bax inhibitor-1/YccA family protein [Proteobacteria bacterium]|nr:Bax inhibitor-1/YccA family protein [Pseudomonadota bacterium]MBS0463271.1 Bax inhibitor-1/YccA family protein [Pseudomonadota bacterium]